MKKLFVASPGDLCWEMRPRTRVNGLEIQLLLVQNHWDESGDSEGHQDGVPGAGAGPGCTPSTEKTRTAAGAARARAGGRQVPSCG